jgi:hypothetical protein
MTQTKTRQRISPGGSNLAILPDLHRLDVIVKRRGIAFRGILWRGDNPQIPRHMQPTEIFMHKWPDVVHLVPNASFLADAPCLIVDRLQRFWVYPRRCCLPLASIPLRGIVPRRGSRLDALVLGDQWRFYIPASQTQRHCEVGGRPLDLTSRASLKLRANAAPVIEFQLSRSVLEFPDDTGGPGAPTQISNHLKTPKAQQEYPNIPET